MILLFSTVDDVYLTVFNHVHTFDFIKLSVFHNTFFEGEWFIVVVTLVGICQFISLELINVIAMKWRNLDFYLGHRYLANTQPVSYSNIG